MKSIFNIIFDEKFIDNVIECHDCASPANHRYFIITNEPRKLSYIKKYNDRIEFLDGNAFLSLLEVQTPDAVFIHDLYSCPFYIIPRIKKEIKVFWFAWGDDLYELPYGPSLIPLELYGAKTTMALRKLKNRFKTRLKKRLLSIICLFKHNSDDNKNTYEKYREAVARIDFFSGVLPIEYEYIKNVPFFKAKKVEYKYITGNDFNSTNFPTWGDGNNIIIGNSANPTNNHLDIFEMLKYVDLGTRKIYVPLSYSSISDHYVKLVVDAGSSLFGENFVPLLTFINKDEYEQIIASCGIAIFGIERQQAIGNIRSAIKYGAKIFLPETSINYKYLTSIGVRVFSLQKDLDTNNLNNLDTNTRHKNFEIIYPSNYRDVQISRINRLYDEI